MDAVSGCDGGYVNSPILVTFFLQRSVQSAFLTRRVMSKLWVDVVGFKRRLGLFAFFEECFGQA